MDLYNIFNQILVIFLVLIVGYAAKKVNAVSDSFCSGLVQFITNISLPAMIISSMNYDFSPQMLLMSGKLLIICIIAYIISIIAAYIMPKVFRIKEQKKGVFQFMIIFANIGYMGIPVINAVYGSQGVFYAAIYNMPFNLLIWTLGVILLQKKGKNSGISFKKLINPGTVSVLIGFAIFIFSIKLPVPIAATINMVGSVTTPLSMFYIGAMLAGEKLGRLFSDPATYEMSFVRLILLPLIVLLVMRPFVSDKLLLGVPVILTAMPAAANTAIMAGLYDADIYTASQGVFISTMLSVLTIPLIIYILSFV